MTTESFASVQAAFFISPTGELINVEVSHIATIIKDPTRFGMTLETIKKTYERFGEKLMVEGSARREILIQMVQEGWTRIRRYPNHFWSIQVNDLNQVRKDWLYGWANVIQAGIWGFREEDPFMPACIRSSRCEPGKYLTVAEISRGDLYSDGESFDRHNGLIINQGN